MVVTDTNGIKVVKINGIQEYESLPAKSQENGDYICMVDTMNAYNEVSINHGVEEQSNKAPASDRETNAYREEVLP